MEHRGYNVYEKSGSVLVEGVSDFDPAQTLDCGQAFRWEAEEDGSYTGVVRGKAANISYNNGVMKIENSNLEDFQTVWFDYLDLGTDYSAIKEKVSRDGTMSKAVAFGSGIRLLRQELWETLISFILSANNRIPRIKKIIASICEAYGDEIRFGGRSRFSFPGPERLSACSLENLAFCKGGFRCRYILETAKLVAGGQFDLRSVYRIGREEARELLLKLPGVGYKVADCTLLFSGARTDVFPTDVWVKRVMEELYFKREASFKEIWGFSRDYFGDLAGPAQQYLFFYARENKIGA